MVVVAVVKYLGSVVVGGVATGTKCQRVRRGEMRKCR